MYDYDLFVIGGGSGGIRAARWSAGLGAKVALCEQDRLGGTCVIRGCIPKKLMVYGAGFPEQFEWAKEYGWKTLKPKLHWDQFNRTRHREISRLEGIYTKLLRKSAVHVVSGKGVLEDAHTVRVNNKLFTSRYILIAVGGKAHRLNIEGAHLAMISDDMFSLPVQPKNLLIIGSGYIALEFASIFNGLGTKVQVLFRQKQVLRGFDSDVRKVLQEEMEHKGVQFLGGRSPVRITKKRQKLYVTDTKNQVWPADRVLMATGRYANTQGLNLESVKIKTSDPGAIPVKAGWQTACPSIFALGDAANTPYALTPVATSEAVCFSEKLFAKKSSVHRLNYNHVPTAVFTNPPVGTVGLTEEQASDQGYEVYESRFRPLKLSLTRDMEKTYIKLIVCQKTQKILGCHIVGQCAGEILQGFAVAVKAGLKKQHWDQTLGIHPTSAEELVTLRTPRAGKRK